MADRVVPGPVDSSALIREAVCIHTKKIYSSCKDKDCVEDLRVFPTLSSQTYIDNAFSVRPRSAELLYAGVDVDEINFNRGYYTVDVTYYYRITGECVPGGQSIIGLSVFNKRVILFGSEGSVKVYSSILAAFGEDLVLNDAARLWYTTLGQFSLIRLERDSQLVIPVYNYSVPENECAGTTDDDPCTLFGRIRFPVEEFYPPDSMEPRESYRGLMQ